MKGSTVEEIQKMADEAHNDILKSDNIRVKPYKVDYVWYNLFDEKIEDTEYFSTKEEADKFSAVVNSGKRFTLADVFYTARILGLKL